MLGVLMQSWLAKIFARTSSKAEKQQVPSLPKLPSLTKISDDRKMTPDTQSKGIVDSSTLTKVRPAWMTFVCIGLWICAVLFSALAVVLLVRSRVLSEVEVATLEKAMFFMTMGSLFALGGVGLWRMEKWGIIVVALSLGAFTVWDLLSNDNVADVILDIPMAVVAIYMGFRLWEIIDQVDTQKL